MSFDGIRGYVQFATGIGDATRARAAEAVSYTHLDVYKRQRTYFNEGAPGEIRLGALVSFAGLYDRGRFKPFGRTDS